MKTTRVLKIYLSLIFSFCVVAIPSFSYANKARLEERLTRLFYWQMSQALDLSTNEEKQMTTVMDSIRKRRLAAIDKRDSVFAKMNSWLEKNRATLSSDQVPPEVVSMLAEYRSQLDTLAKIDVEEHEELQKLLGDLRLLKFYNERKIIIERIKKALN
jgi:ribosome-binding ATPase YchF (GTP1/OBG family)